MTRTVLDAKISFWFDNLKISLIMINHSIVEWNYPRHSHGNNFYELHYIDGGEGKIVCGDNEYEVENGLIVMTGPNVFHEQITDQDNKMSEYCFQFEISENPRRKSTKESKLLKDTVFWIGKDSQRMIDIFRRLDIEYSDNNIGFMHMARSLVNELLVALIRNYNGSVESEDYSKVSLNEKRTLICDEIFLFEYATVTLESLSSRLGLSIRQTQRFLQKAYGDGFINIRKRFRLEKAKELIRDGMSPQEAAIKVGYESAKSLGSTERGN